MTLLLLQQIVWTLCPEQCWPALPPAYVVTEAFSFMLQLHHGLEGILSQSSSLQVMCIKICTCTAYCKVSYNTYLLTSLLFMYTLCTIS